MSIKAMEQALKALEWYVENDDVVESMPGNEFWVEGKREAEKAIQELRTAIQQAESEPVARVELMQTGGNAGLATRIVEIDDPLRERLRPGDVLYTHPAPGVPDGCVLVPLKATPKVAMVLYEGARNCFSPKVAECLWQDALTAAQAQKGGAA